MELGKRILSLVVLWLCFMFMPMKWACSADSLKPLCKQEERKALLSFKSGINDSSSSRLSSWAGDECCQWEGVVCHNVTGHVLQLNLGCEEDEPPSLGGKISSSLLELKQLQHLDLRGNDLGGPIPKFLGSISTLIYLDLSRTGFCGAVPSQLGNLSKLYYLDIGYSHCFSNFLYAEDLEWFSGLTSLEYLDMSRVNLSKASNWLQVMNRLPSLEMLHLSDCDLHTIDHLPHVNFSSLASLDLSSNYFISLSFDWLAHLNSLVVLDLSVNNIEGPVPSWLQNMTSLRFLDLSLNKFASPIPKWLFHIATLEHLGLRSCMLRGTIENDIENLTSIVYLDLSNNALEGENILKSLASICVHQLSNLSYHRLEKSLEFLQLVENEFSGSFPYTLGQCRSLKALILGRNRFSGQIPVSLGGISSLRVLEISYNLFEGVITEKHFANLTSLAVLSASSNTRLSLQVSANWTLPFQLRVLNIGSWHIGLQFPGWLQTQKSLEFLNMSDTGISGAMPAWVLEASHNEVDLSYNRITGPLPQIPSHVVAVDFSYNFFRGSLSPMLCHGTKEVNLLVALDVSGNFLSGELPDCWMYWTDLQGIKLDNNNLSGGIPSSMGSLRRLLSLHLRNNGLSGILPPSMQNCSNLISVDLGGNEFSGTIPVWMGNLNGVPDDDIRPGLRVLVLRSNKFSGDIPVELCNLRHSLQILDLAHNRLSGTIPPCFGNFTPMSIPQYPYHDFNDQLNDSTYVYLETAYLNMKRGEYKFRTRILEILTGIDLSCNNLSGQIPPELTNLHGLIFLNLSNNHLHGKVPWDVGGMKSLESLDLAINNLSGAIPPSMTGMSFLGTLNLSYNHFSGRIPSGTQIRGFDPSSFIGNDGLCGPPLTDDCPVDHALPSQPLVDANNDEDEDDWIDMKWFYLSLPLGFVVGFWAVLAPLAFKRAWRLAYFQALEDMKYKLFGWT